MTSDDVPEKMDREAGCDLSHNSDQNTSQLKLDKKGLPLSPQPTARKDDPLVCREDKNALYEPFIF